MHLPLVQSQFDASLSQPRDLFESVALAGWKVRRMEVDYGVE
jgi:hypothetical protein